MNVNLQFSLPLELLSSSSLTQSISSYIIYLIGNSSQSPYYYIGITSFKHRLTYIWKRQDASFSLLLGVKLWSNVVILPTVGMPNYNLECSFDNCDKCSSIFVIPPRITTTSLEWWISAFTPDVASYVHGICIAPNIDCSHKEPSRHYHTTLIQNLDITFLSSLLTEINVVIHSIVC